MSAEKYEESFISWQNIAHYRRFENSTWLHVWIAAWQGLAKNISRWGVVLALTLVFATISPAFAADYRYSISNDEATITKYNGTGGDVVIPSSLNEYPVTSIGYEAFLYCSSLTSVVIPDSVTSIGEWAFYVCSGLTSMVIPDGVTSIGFCAFSYCSSLTSVVIADSVTSTSIGVRAFYGCSNLTSVVIPDSVTSIGDYAFQNCSGLTSVVIPDSVTSIGNHAFYGCSGLTSVVIPDSVTSIGNHAFYGCSGLTSVVFGNGVTSIGDYAFRVCSSLKSVVIPDSVTSIGNYAFSSSSNLTSMVIPDSVTSIGDYAFYSCYGLTSVVIGNSVTNIGSSAFYSCSSLTSVVIGNSVTSIGSSAFSGCTGLTSMVIPDSVTSIGNRAFYGCKGLTSVVIPDSVTSIGDYAFQNCSGLTSVVIPDSVTFLGRNMFYRCTSLSSVVFLGNVTYVGVEAFAQCKNLAGVYFAGLPPTLGGSDVFTNCPSVIYYISGTPGWGEEYGGRPTAVWTNNATFDGNGGTPTVSEQTYNAGVTYPDLPTANRPGFSFSGWWTEADGGTQITEDILVPLLTVGCMLYAQWEVSPGFFSVKFELGVHGMRTGGDEQHQAIKDGMAAEPPGVTPRQGWGFFGWDRDFSHVTAPMTVRAVYSYPYTLASGWNLISINLILSDDSCVKLQNNGAIILDSNSKAYVHSGNLASYHSCWIHCQDAKTITVVGTSPDNFELPVTLKKDWNFVGPIIDSFLSGDNAIAWEWNGQYFSPTENLRSGSGYYLYLPNNHAEVIPIIGDYFIIDLSAGPEAASYPMSFLAEIPAGGWTDEYKTTKLVLRKISAGTFTMGSPEDELGRESGSTQHQVTLTKDFYVGVFAVTQKQWERVMGNWPSYFYNTSYRDTRPVERVSYENIRGSGAGAGWPANNAVDSDSFLGRLRAKTGLTLDLPTDAQWEYACRAGTTTALNSGKNLTNIESCPNVAEVGRYSYNGGRYPSYSAGGDTSVGTAKVGSYLPNQWGLYDMHGNVYEWCLDWRQIDLGSAAQVDPVGPDAGSCRLLRGGDWYGGGAQNCRSARRGCSAPERPIFGYGFRIAFLPSVPAGR